VHSCQLHCSISCKQQLSSATWFNSQSTSDITINPTILKFLDRKILWLMLRSRNLIIWITSMDPHTPLSTTTITSLLSLHMCKPLLECSHPLRLVYRPTLFFQSPPETCHVLRDFRDQLLRCFSSSCFAVWFVSVELSKSELSCAMWVSGCPRVEVKVTNKTQVRLWLEYVIMLRKTVTKTSLGLFWDNLQN
jgi:hypothetical protein